MMPTIEYDFREYWNVTGPNDFTTAVFAGLNDCIRSAFNVNMPDAEASEHLSGDHLVVAAHPNTGSIDGYASSTVTSPSVVFSDTHLSDQVGLYLAAAAIRRNCQGIGLYKTLNAIRMRFLLSTEAELLFTRTQNPRVQEGVERALDGLVSSGSLVSYHRETSRITGAYGRMLTLDVPRSRTVEFTNINYQRGDALILYWYLTRPARV